MILVYLEMLPEVIKTHKTQSNSGVDLLDLTTSSYVFLITDSNCGIHTIWETCEPITRNVWVWSEDRTLLNKSKELRYVDKPSSIYAKDIV